MRTYILILLILISCVPTRAELLDFTFSLTSAPGLSQVNGTVTGEIIGLPYNPFSSAPQTSIPSDILITSAPVGLGLNISPQAAGFVEQSGASFPPYVFSVKSHGWSYAPSFTTFTITDGAIAPGTDFITFLNTGSTLTSLSFNTAGGYNALQYYVGSSVTRLENQGLSGASFMPVAAPEPRGLILALAAAVIFLLGRSVQLRRTWFVR